MKIALFRLSGGAIHVGTEDTERYTQSAKRTSEYIDVEFPPLAPDVVEAQLEQQRQASIAYHRGELAKLVGHETGVVASVSLAKRQAE